MTKKSMLLLAIAAFMVTATLFIRSAYSSRATAAAATVAAQSERTTLIAGPGRVEPVSEDIKIGSELSGKLKSVNVEEGDRIHAGQVLAVLENDDYLAEVRSAEAQLLAKEAVLRKVINGARHQERAEAYSSATEAKAVLDNARAEMDRRQ